jgi:hypothetical protein
MKNLVNVEVVDGKDYVSLADAKRIMGVKSVGDLKSLGSATITVGTRKTLWSLGWIISQAKGLRHSEKYNSDMDWIKEYETRTRDAAAMEERVAAPHVAPDSSTSDGDYSVYLNELRKLLPPPDDVPCNDVDWDAIERVMRESYPESFKSFVAVYGALQWFDWLRPLVPYDNMSPEDFRKYLDNVFRDNLEGDIRDAKGKPLSVPKFGSPGGWLPFMIGSDGEVYVWNTIGTPDQWGVICVDNCHATVLPPLSLPEMLAGWLQGKPAMDQLWGSVDEFRRHSPKRLTMLR